MFSNFDAFEADTYRFANINSLQNTTFVWNLKLDHIEMTVYIWDTVCSAIIKEQVTKCVNSGYDAVTEDQFAENITRL